MDAATLLGIGANMVVANPSVGAIPKENAMESSTAALTPANQGIVSAQFKVWSFSALKHFGMGTVGFVSANLVGAGMSAVFGAEGNTKNWMGMLGSGISAGIGIWRGAATGKMHWHTFALGSGINLVRHMIAGIVGLFSDEPKLPGGSLAGTEMMSMLRGLGLGNDEVAELLNGLSEDEADQLLGALAEMSPAQLQGLAGEPSAQLSGEPSAQLSGLGAGNELLERLLAAA